MVCNGPAQSTTPFILAILLIANPINSHIASLAILPIYTQSIYNNPYI